jgi:hypothetical protein
VVRVDLAGKITGAVFLLGRIGYDPASRSVLIGDAIANGLRGVRINL